jgi:glycosyltransferase involved in cell wall biosynthesis
VTVGKVILLLGRRDEPTDGVADYCEKLREAGLPRGLSFELFRIPWTENGWGAALAELRKASASWRDCWVLLQYTTLAWSRRGFPVRAPRLLEILRQSGTRPGVVFHDFLPAQGSGIVGNTREFLHLRVLRQLFVNSELAIFTVPLKIISWLPQSNEKAAFIPVGANCSEAIPAIREESPKIKSVAVYSITGGAQASIEVADLGTALKRVQQAAGPVRLLLFGRGSREAEPALRAELKDVDIEIESLGLLSRAEVQNVLARADALLFVRGQISTRRGSAIAGIASGLPIVCYSGSETAWPITEAGIFAAPQGDRESLAAALENVLTDGAFRRTLAERSRIAHEKYFSWEAIAGRFAEELHLRDKASAATGPRKRMPSHEFEPGGRAAK